MILICWVIAYGIISNNNIMLSLQPPVSVSLLFFSGVYIGKLLTLYGYRRISMVIKSKTQNINVAVNKVTGILLICISFIPAIKLYAI